MTRNAKISIRIASLIFVLLAIGILIPPFLVLLTLVFFFGITVFLVYMALTLMTDS